MTNAAGRNNDTVRIGLLEALLYVALPMVIAVATGARQLPGVIAGGLVNPDSYMRLVRLEAELRQHEIIYVVARDGSGAGTELHWSHLIDSLLSLVISPFSLVLDQHAAVHLAASVFGPMSIGLLGLALAWAALPLADRSWLWLAPTAAALSIPIAAYGLPGEAHHHVLLVLVAVMTGGWALRAIRGQAREGAGVALGAWGGLGLWLSPEIMPLDLMAFGALWLAWLITPDRGDLARFICQVAATLLLVTGCALAVDPPYAGYTSVELDRISIIYFVLALVCCALAIAALLIERAHPRSGSRLVLGLALPIAGLGMWVALYPNLLRGADGVMSAANAHVFHTIIAEMQPVRSVATAIQYLLTGSVAATMLLWFALRRRSLLISYAALCGWTLVALGAMHLRFAAYPSAAGAVLLPVLVTVLSASLARRPERVRIIARLAVVAPLLMGLRAGIVPGLTSAAKAADGHALPNCRVSGLGPVLAPYSGQVVLANVGDTPELLYRTELRTVGSLYLRGIPAFLRSRAAWRSMPSESIPDAVQQTGATLVLACPSGDRSPLVLDLPPETLADRLSRGEIPPWLEKVAEDKASGNVLYRVIQ